MTTPIYRDTQFAAFVVEFKAMFHAETPREDIDRVRAMVAEIEGVIEKYGANYAIKEVRWA